MALFVLEGNMAGCITSDYKEILTNFVQQEMKHELLAEFIKAIPACEVVTPEPAVVAEAKKRRIAIPWGIEPEYIDEKGKKTTFSSPSALIKHLGLPLSGIQCDIEGKKCKAMDVMEIMRIHGYAVSGNGDPKKAVEGGTKLTIWHPESLPKE